MISPGWVGRLGVGAALALVLAGCGSGPSYRYVASDDRSLVMKVPAGWAEIPPADLGVTSTADFWHAYFDASGRADPSDFVKGGAPLSDPTSPVVTVSSRKTPAGTQHTTAELADLGVPASLHALKQMDRQSWLDDAPTLQNFGVVEQTVVSTPTSQGVRTVTAYNFGGSDIVLEKLALADKAGRHVHLIQVWCVLKCFVDNRQQIDQVLATFTVKQL